VAVAIKRKRAEKWSALGGGEEGLDDVEDEGQPLTALAHKIELHVRVALVAQLDVACRAR
jgi:hypothetical protein